MKLDLRERGVRSVLLDVEGTTTPVSFVYEVLFPYARAHMGEFLHSAAGRAALPQVSRLLRDEHARVIPGAGEAPRWSDSDPAGSVLDFSVWLMDRDVKSPGLKLLQGLIWERGYSDGSLVGEVFPDVPDAFARLRSAGVILAIYSSGSELAQRLIFGHTRYGDLTQHLSAFFDTAVGPKREPDSYMNIANRLGMPAGAVLFVSDIEAELDAAQGAGMQTALCVRPGNAPVSGRTSSPVIAGLGELLT